MRTGEGGSIEDHDEARVALLIGKWPLCLGCISARLDWDQGYADNILLNLNEAGRIVKTMGLCQKCGRQDMMFRCQPPSGPQPTRGEPD